MMRSLYAVSLLFVSVAIAISAPPKLDIPAEIQANGDYVTFIPDTDAVSVVYVGLSGIEPFPSGMLRDSRGFILPVRGLKDGRYTFAAIGSKKDEQTRRDFTVVIGKGTPTPIPPKPPTPVPPKPPTPIPPPQPKLDDAPTKTDGLHVVFVYETGNKISGNHFNIMYGVKVRNWLELNCDVENKLSQYKLIDKDQIPVTEPWKNALSRKRSSVPWLVVMNGKKYVYESALPDVSEDEFLKVLTKYKPNAKQP